MNKSNDIDWKSIFSFQSIGYTVSGLFIAAVALKGFMMPNGFLDGGVTAISVLINIVFQIHISLLLIVFNIPFLIIGYQKLGKTFIVRSTIAILIMAILLYFFNIRAITHDKILIALFGGFLMGLGIGLVIRGGAVIDGLEIIAHYTTKKVAFTSSEIIMLFNSLVIISGALAIGPETGMYSILVYYTAMKTSDYVVDGFEEFTSLNVISKEHDQIKSLIVNDFGKAITVYKGERGHLPGSFDIKYDCDIIMTVVTRLEIHRMKQEISKIDENAFFFVHSIKEVKGGITKKWGLKT